MTTQIRPAHLQGSKLPRRDTRGRGDRHVGVAMTAAAVAALISTSLAACGGSGTAHVSSTVPTPVSASNSTAETATAAATVAPATSSAAPPATPLQRWFVPTLGDVEQIATLFGNVGDGSALKGSDCRSIVAVTKRLTSRAPAPDAGVRAEMREVTSSLEAASRECAKGRAVAASAYLFDALTSVAPVINHPGLGGNGSFTIPPVPDAVRVGFWFSKLQDVLTKLPQQAGTVSVDLTTQQYGGGATPDCASLATFRLQLKKSPPPDYVSVRNTWTSLLADLATEEQACDSGNSSVAATAADSVTADTYALIQDVQGMSGSN